MGHSMSNSLVTRLRAEAQVTAPIGLVLEAADHIAELESWIRDADHHPGCSAGFTDGTQYACKCGLSDLLEAQQGHQ